MIMVPYYGSRKFRVEGDVDAPVAIEGYDNLVSCPFCKSDLSTVDLRKLYDFPDIRTQLSKVRQWIHRFSVEECTSCGWWQVYFAIQDGDYKAIGHAVYETSTLKEFELSSKDIPIKALGDYLASKSEDIYYIHHRKMEELVGSVLREHFNCNVLFCGGSHDRGIDLLLVESDELIPIQVKRRTRPGVTEGVRTIREMLGVMFRDRYRKAMVISTADKFSRDARIDINQVVNAGLVDSFELIDFDSFSSLLRTYFGQRSLTWVAVCKDLCDNSLVTRRADADHEAIAARAYAIWEERGRPAGADLADWLAAEAELHPILK